MSRAYTFEPIRGEYPFIQTEVRDGQRYVQLICDVYSTAVHRHFEAAWQEWNDHAATVFMEDILTNANTTD